MTRRTLLCFGGSSAVASLSGCILSNPTDGRDGVARIVATDGATRDRFGYSLDITNDGRTLIVGATLDTNSNGRMAGGVYVFRRDEDGWHQSAKLTADDGDRGDWFGSAVSISDDGDIALVGAQAENDPNGAESGAVYVYHFEETDWQQRQKLIAPDGDSFDQFSRSVELTPDGTTAFIGAPFKENSSGNETGAIYEYRREPDGWTLVNTLVPSDWDLNGSFGSTLDISNGGQRLFISGSIVSEPDESETAAAVFVVEKAGKQWVRRGTLTASDGDPRDFFGETILATDHGQSVLVGAPNDEDPHGEHSGSVYLFEERPDDWHQQQNLTAAEGGRGDRFGLSIETWRDTSTILVGAPGESSETGEQSRICVFRRDGNQWRQERVIPAPRDNPTDLFGTRIVVAEEAGLAAVSAPESDGHEQSSGAVYVYDLAATLQSGSGK